MSKLSLEELASLDVLQAAYISALDGKAMKAWLDTFDDDPDASYICTARNDVECGLKVAMMLDDCRDRLIDRCTFIEDIWAGTFQDYRTRHFAQRVTAERREDGSVAMSSNFSVIFTPDDTGLLADRRDRQFGPAAVPRVPALRGERHLQKIYDEEEDGE